MGIGFTEIFVILFLIPFACLPSIIAIGTNHPQKLPIILVNILGLPIGGLGWLPWFGAFFATMRRMWIRQAKKTLPN